MDSWASVFRAIEDVAGSALVPGQHGGFSGLASDHNSIEYFEAVADRAKDGQVKTRKQTAYVTKLLAPLVKLLIPTAIGAVQCGLLMTVFAISQIVFAIEHQLQRRRKILAFGLARKILRYRRVVVGSVLKRLRHQFSTCVS